MKSLSLSRPLILIVIGVPGAGKSFFARQFAETFHAPLVHTDYIRSCVTALPTFDRDEENVVRTLADQQVRELLKTEKTFLIDGGLNARSERFVIARLAKENGYGTLTVWVQTDEPTSKIRAMKRSSRRQGDQYNLPLSAAQFSALAKRLTPPAVHEPYVVVSGKHTYATQAKVVLKKLVAFKQETTALVQSESTAYSAQAYDQPQPSSQSRRRNVIIN